jgi:tetratricopeptide (TPR) repeat protein
MTSHKKLDTDLDEVQGLFNQSKFDLALLKVSKLIKNNKKHFLPYNYRGIILLKKGDHSQALVDFKKATDLNPNFLLGYNNIALCYRAMGNIEYAVNNLKKVIQLDPNILETRINLGSCYSDLGKYAESLDEFQHALKFNDENEFTHHLIADVFIKILNFKSAREHHQKALTINPGNFMNYFLIATDDLWAGDHINAAKNFRKAIELNPDFTESFYGLSRAEKISRADPVIQLAEKMISIPTLSDNDQVFLKFFLARVYEIDKNEELFFKFLREGSATKKSITKYSATQSLLLFNKIKNIYLKHIDTLSEPNNKIVKSKNEINPIFIVGMPRSGTSLIEQILSNHSLVFGAGEVPTLHGSLLSLFSLGVDTKSFEEELQKIKNDYLKHLSVMTEKKIVTDKLPLNFLWIGFILYMFPNAKILHIVREPIATCFSIYKTLFSPGSLEFSYDEEDIIEFYKLYEDIMQFWNAYLPNHTLTIPYEELVDQPQEIMQKVFSFIDLPYDGNVLNIQNNKRSVTTASDLQIRNHIYKGSSKSWMVYEKNLQKFTQAFTSY